MWFSSAAVLSAVVAVCQASAIVLDQNFGVSCAPITYNPKSKLPATIELYISLITLDDQDKLKDFKFPVLIFHATDVYNFSNIPEISAYDEEYYSNWSLLRDTVVDGSGNKFKIDIASGYPELDSSKLLNTYVALDTDENAGKPEHIDVIFPVKKTGIYCVYIAPPADGIVELKVPIRYQSSYGFLTLSQYAFYSQYKYLITIGVALFAYLFYYIVKMVGSDFNALNSLSVISRLTVFYIIPPAIFMQIIDYILLGVKNKHIASNVNNRAFEFFEATFDIIESLFSVYFSAIFLLFSMGYGVIYYHKGSRKYREMPLPLLKKVKILFIVNAVACALRIICGEDGTLSPMYGQTLKLLFPQMILYNRRSWFVSIIAALSGFAALMLPLVWSICSIYYYFKTKKLIAKFPPVQSGNSDTNEKIAKSFRRSVIVIIGLPSFIFILGMFVFGFQAGMSNPQLYAKKFHNDEERLLVIYEYMVLGDRLESVTFWVSISAYYITVVLFYFIWVRGNNGLLVNDETLQDYDDVAQYEVYSDDDAQVASNDAHLNTISEEDTANLNEDINGSAAK